MTTVLSVTCRMDKHSWGWHGTVHLTREKGDPHWQWVVRLTRAYRDHGRARAVVHRWKPSTTTNRAHFVELVVYFTNVPLLTRRLHGQATIRQVTRNGRYVDLELTGKRILYGWERSLPHDTGRCCEEEAAG